MSYTGILFSFHIAIISMISLWVHSLLPLLLFLFDIRLLSEEHKDAEFFTTDAILLSATCSWFCTILLEFSSMFLCKISFSSSCSNACLPFSVLKKIDANGRISQWETFSKKGIFFCQVSMFWTLVDLFCTKRLFSQETAFSPGYFTRDNARNSFLGRVAWWLATCARKPKVPGSRPAASYVQR